MRCAILLGEGRYADELAGFGAEEGPRPEFLVLARLTGATIISYRAASARRGGLFARLFGRKPLIGSAIDFALRAGQADRCYFTGEDVGLYAALLLRARGWRGKLFGVVHNVTPRKVRLFKLVGHGIFGGLITVSEKQARALIDDCGIPASKVHFLHNWVDDVFYTPPGVDAGPPDIVTFMACGAENRDYPTLIAAAPRVDADFELYAHGFFGTNAGAGGLAAMDHARIRRMPRVSFPDLRAAYQRCSAVVLPLNDVDYAAGVTGLVEAMACGKPVVVSGSIGLTGYLDSIDPALVARPHDTDDMARALGAFVSRGIAAEADGARNRAWVEEHCGVDRYAARVRDLMAAH